MAPDFITTVKLSQLDGAAFLKPPTWTRLEPQSASGDPRPGIEARVHDPCWLLCRQWQLGEFEGEDAGTPLTVRVATRSVALDRWAAAGEGAEVRRLTRTRSDPLEPVVDLLEPMVEREPVEPGSGPGLRPRAEAGAALLAALDDAGLGVHREAFVENCRLVFAAGEHPDGDHAELDPQWVRLERLLDGRELADGELICRAVEDAGGGLPAWLVPAGEPERAALLAVIEPWADHYRAEVSPAAGGHDAWVGERLEYRFRVGAGDTVLNAPAHGGGDIDWHSFDAAPGTTLPQPAAAAPADEHKVHTLLASPLRYPGMPADRLWEMEDARVNLGLIEAEPWDLARLLVAEFALTYGNDWLVAPVDVPCGSLTTVESVLYTTTFGEHFLVKPTDAVSPDGHWRMFTITEPDGTGIDGLLIPPGAVDVQDGSPFEEVLFLRDEMANMAWAVERCVQGPSGAARDRSREPDDPGPFGRGPVTSAQLDYLLQTGLPARWIPYLPRSKGYAAIELVQGSMTEANRKPIAPLGRLLAREDVKVLVDAEVPREGVVVRRQPSMTRRADGSYVRWTTRRVAVGRGEGSSQLAFDSAIDRRPRPNTDR